jgi:hypothetical protein
MRAFAVYLTASGDDDNASSTLGVRDTNKMTAHHSTARRTRSMDKGSRTRSKDTRTLDIRLRRQSRYRH